MRKPAFCICENKDADQLRGNREADQRLCFRYMASTIPLLPKFKINFKPLAILFGCTAPFVSDLVGNPEDRFSQNEAQIPSLSSLLGCLEEGEYNVYPVVKKATFVQLMSTQYLSLILIAKIMPVGTSAILSSICLRIGLSFQLFSKKAY